MVKTEIKGIEITYPVWNERDPIGEDTTQVIKEGSRKVIDYFHRIAQLDPEAQILMEIWKGEVFYRPSSLQQIRRWIPWVASAWIHEGQSIRLIVRLGTPDNTQTMAWILA